MVWLLTAQVLPWTGSDARSRAMAMLVEELRSLSCRVWPMGQPDTIAVTRLTMWGLKKA